MKDLGYEIHRIIEHKELLKKDIAEKVGITPSQLGQIRKRKDLSCSMLEKFCKALDVHPAYFFDDSYATAYNFGDIHNASESGPATVNVGDRKAEESGLEKVLEEKEKVIEEKERVIRILMKMSGVTDIM